MVYQTVNRWTIGRSYNGSLIVVPIFVKYESKAGYNGVITKKEQTIKEIVSCHKIPLLVVTKEKFPQIDNKGNAVINGLISIEGGIVKSKTIDEAYKIISYLNDR